MRLRHILCPVDFSTGSRLALDTAVELAVEAGARLTVAHVHEMPSILHSEAAVAMPALAEKLQAEAGRELEKARGEAQRLGAPEVETALVPGVAWDQIVKLARARDCDLVVMGTHGRTGLEHALLGSVAERVARHAHCPVLVVRPQA
jgi:nucleotide-binding universal stress UspA family protein